MSQIKKKCPLCKTTDHVVLVFYGLPSDKMLRLGEKGEVKLGGCCIVGDMPEWYCKKHKKLF